MGVEAFGPWVAHHRPRPHAEVRLFCFAYSGGSAMAFRTWAEGLPESIEVCPIQLPGRERRFTDRLIGEWPELIETVAPLFREVQDKPYALFGHSLGALVAFEMARELRRLGLQAPVRLFASGCVAPAVRKPKPLHELPDDEFIAEVLGIGGTPDEVMQNQDLLELILPMLRSDFKLACTYPYAEETALDIPITAFGGTEDERVSPEQLAAWGEETSQAFDSRMFPGGHFFLREGQAELLAAISAHLAKVRA